MPSTSSQSCWLCRRSANPGISQPWHQRAWPHRPNVFATVLIPDDEKSARRLPIPDGNLLAIQKECVEMDDDVGWVVAPTSDTGTRLAEAAGRLASLPEAMVLSRLAQRSAGIEKHKGYV